jgi:mono/diheme cytochrome c family protein
MSSGGRRVLHFVVFLVIVAAVLSAFAAWQLQHVASLPAQPVTPFAASSLLVEPIAEGPNAEQVRHGQYLVRVGDCLSCHLAPGGQPFAGGLGLNTPFGVIYSANITPDTKTGIGNWTPDQFYSAMHDGKGSKGRLYPAFPYPWFTRVNHADDDAIFAYLKTIPPVDYTPPANRLPFPLGIRGLVGGWNLLFFRKTEFTADTSQSAEWNRGAEIVGGLGHCTACHSPKNVLGAEKSAKKFEGGVLEGFVAPDLTGNGRAGLGSWTLDDITEYLQTGSNARAGASGPMAEVITYSTSLMTDADRHAIAVYLKSLPASGDESTKAPDAIAMKRGAAIYSDACASCHLEDGVGQPRFFPPLGKNAVVQQRDPTSVVHLVLAGGRVGPSATRPSPLTMPSFAWKLSDQEIADVSTFLRNSWGNQAAPVSADQVKRQREKLDLTHEHLTENSGDHAND